MKKLSYLLITVILFSLPLFLKAQTNPVRVAPTHLEAEINQTTGEVNLRWLHLEKNENFNENFDDGRADYMIPIDRGWKVENGVLKVSSATFPTNSIYRMGEYAAYEYEAILRKTSEDRCGIGLYFNADPTNILDQGIFGNGHWTNGYRLYMCYETGNWNLAKIKDGEISFLQPFTGSPNINTAMGDYNKLKIVYADGFIEVYFNDIKQDGSYFDEDFKYGHTGIIFYDDIADDPGGNGDIDEIKLNKLTKNYTFGKVNNLGDHEVYSLKSENLGCECLPDELLRIEKSPEPPVTEGYTFIPNEEKFAFSQFRIYENNSQTATTTDLAYSKNLPVNGDFDFQVSGFYSEGESPKDGPLTIVYSGSQHFTPVWSGAPSSPMLIYITEANYNGNDLLPGDEIGVFDGDFCVGTAIVTQTVTRMNPLQIVTSKDLTGTAQRDGFIEGNNISFRYWLNDEQAFINSVETTNYLGDGKFKGNGSVVIYLGSNVVIDPFVTITSPNGGEQWKVGEIYDITWEGYGLTSVQLEYSVNAGTDWNDITVIEDASVGTYAWTVPNNVSDECLIQIYDISGMFDVSDNVFSIIPPDLIVLAPNGGEVWTANTNATIVWQSNNVETLKIEYSIDGGTSWILEASGVDASGGSYQWLVPDTASTQALVKLTDESDESTTDQSDAVFTIDDPSSTGDEITGLPKEYKLSQNFPNPFNPTTIISYQLPQRSFVTLKVYDLLGKEVAVLVNEEKNPGYHKVNFNAGGLSSGIYFYRLETTEFRDGKKLILLK
ncbi:MAG: T9SS type A sorting domain-containing protein [Melioribacteraceae bacterium]|nr:T9SS type A sorting domain-containing protein [Melioribacteraceae bacterium]